MGWQHVTFSTPVAVSAGATYTASYRAPNGGYSYTAGGLAEPVNRGPLNTIYQGGAYTYGSGAPTNSSHTNYWVDVDFVANDAPPTVAGSEPGTDATNVSINAPITVALKGWVAPGSANMVLTRAENGAPVSGAVGWNPTTKTVSFTPYEPLVAASSYVATVSGAQSFSGAVMSPASFSFRTTGATMCPCSLFSSSATPAVIDSGETAALNLGVRFIPTVDGSVTGLRFYKAEANTGTHSGSLWTADGTLLARVAFTNETASGWQKAQFSSAIAVTAGTTYVVSYHAPEGHYSATPGFFVNIWDNDLLRTPMGHNGVFAYGAEAFPSHSFDSANYWVDPLFVADGVAVDSLPPTITAVTATPDATGTTLTVAWTTDEVASSVVPYGVSPGDLNGTGSSVSGLNHSVVLSGLSQGMTYYYRVESADVSGNSATSPSLLTAPASITMPDSTPPVVSGVTASGSGTTATVAWTTDESSTSRIQYGTSATALTESANGSVGTAHTVALTGLAPNTRYFYRVTSADAAGNSSTVPTATSQPASFVPAIAPISTTSVADFSTGSGAYVADSAGGEITSTPAAGYEFAGSTLPAGLASSARATGSTTVVGSNAVTLNGTQVATTATWASGTMAVSTTLAAGHIVGFASSNGATSGSRFIFSMNASGALSAIVSDGLFTNRTMAIAGSWTGAPHEFRIDNTGSTVTFFIDGVQKASSSVFLPPQLKVMLVDPTNDASSLVVDWLRIGSYAASSAHTSAVIDAGAKVGWDTMLADQTVPAGTTVTLRVRSGNTPTPDASWTAYTTASSVGAITRSARYVQYQVVLTTSGTRFVTPVVRSVTLGYHVL
jgi:hypothetical protein